MIPKSGIRVWEKTCANKWLGRDDVRGKVILLQRPISPWQAIAAKISPRRCDLLWLVGKGDRWG